MNSNILFFALYRTINRTGLNSTAFQGANVLINRICLKLTREKLYVLLFFLLTIKCKLKTREKFLQIFYRKIYSIRCHFVQCLPSEILLPVVFHENISCSFLNSRNSIIDSQRDPATQKRNLLTWFFRRCYIRFRS